MLRVGVGVFLILHGVIHAAIWIPPRPEEPLPGFGSQASWLFADVRAAMVSLALLAASGFALAGVAYLSHRPWWAAFALIAAAASLALTVATFTPWWSAAIAIDLAVIYAAWGPLVGQVSRE
jgi:nicotinamide riboside transporter PnuC